MPMPPGGGMTWTASSCAGSRKKTCNPPGAQAGAGGCAGRTFDLTGLPPTPGEIDSFLADDSPGAFAKVVDRLLESPRYGEHWARHWLDGVRYVSDVGYYNFSDLGWRYRDWVIRALNEDLPYDQFVVHQLAGDLLPSPTGKGGYPDGVIATGVLAMGNYDDQESNKEQLYAEVIDDQIDLVSRQFLGLTISCARCHDHKFDPISTADYYSLGGIFLSSRVLETKNRIGAHRLKIALVSSEGKEQGTAIGIQEGGYSNSRHKKIGGSVLSRCSAAREMDLIGTSMESWRRAIARTPPPPIVPSLAS